MAVGTYDGTEGQLPLAERWDGGSWILESPVIPSGASGVMLTGVSCVSGADCVAVGESTYELAVAGGMVTGEDLTLAEHWDGVAWTIVPTPNPTAVGANGYTGAELLGISCSSSIACTAVGTYESWPPNSRSFVHVLTLAERWDGTRWTIQATPTPATVPGNPIVNGGVLNAVSCPSAAMCMAGGAIADYGTSLAEYYNGKRWSIRKTDDPRRSLYASFNGAACTSPTACIAVGDSNIDVFDVTAVNPLAERWDGAGWMRINPVIPPGPPLARYGRYSPLEGISCASSTACVAVGSFDQDQANLIEMWNGQNWMIQTAPSPADAQTTDLGGVSCSGTFCSAVGGYTTQSGAFAQALTSTVVSAPVVSMPAGLRISGLRATPLSTGVSPRSVPASERPAQR